MLAVFATCQPLVAAAQEPLSLQRILENGRLSAAQPLSDGRDAVLVAVFATWCEPCKEEIPILSRIQEDIAGRGVRVVGVSVDTLPPHEIARWLKDLAVGYPAFFANAPVRAGRTALGDTATLPKLVLLSARGRILRQWRGKIPETIIRAALEPLLKPAPAAPKKPVQPKGMRNRPSRSAN